MKVCFAAKAIAFARAEGRRIIRLPFGLRAGQLRRDHLLVARLVLRKDRQSKAEKLRLSLRIARLNLLED